ncbi:MAG: hypothetical protein J1E42_08585 [Akkermansiaceae bacterium]|nr:hypothetical protein [Akkermansiaceae bacterium]
MKTTLATLIAAMLVSTVVAAPSISASDVSSDALRKIATDKQRASLEIHEKAKAKAEEEREKAIQEAKEITARNDAGMKRTIQGRHLNSMLPPCDREPEQPRESNDYHIRY